MDLIKEYSSSEESEEEILHDTSEIFSQEFYNLPLSIEIFSQKYYTTMSNNWGTLLLSMWNIPPLAKNKIHQACTRVLEEVPLIAQNYKLDPLYNHTFRQSGTVPLHLSLSPQLSIPNRNADLAKQILFEETKRLQIPSSLIFQESVDPKHPLSSVLLKNPKKVLRFKFDKNLILFGGFEGFRNSIILAAKIKQTPDTREFFKAIDSGVIQRLCTECEAHTFRERSLGLEHISVLQGSLSKKTFPENTLRFVKYQVEQIDVSDLIGDINVDLDSIELDTGTFRGHARQNLFQ